MEGLGKIRSKFAGVNYVGPRWVADFLETAEKDDRDILMRRAYEKVSELLNALEIRAWEGA